MKIQTIITLTGLVSMLLTGCSSVSIPENLVRGPSKIDPTATGFSTSMENSYPALEAAYWQIKGSDQNVKLCAVNNNALLPKIFVSDPVVSKIIVAMRESLAEGTPHNVSISKGDLLETARLIQNNFGIASLNLAASGHQEIAADNANSTVFTTAQSYLYAYVVNKDGFVDRNGTKYVAPEFSGSIENAEITAVVSILVEAVCDQYLGTPVWLDAANNPVTKTGLKPSYFTLVAGAKTEPLASGAGHIDQTKLNVMNYVANFGGVQSKMVSGMVFRLLGKVNIGFAVEGGLSFGDNQTLAQILDTIFQSASQRLTMAACIPIFKDINVSARGSVSISSVNDPIHQEAVKLVDQLK
jgi:hypothetical protein